MDIARHVIETYINDTPNLMVRHHIDSFNDFLTTKIPNYIRNSNPIKLSLEDGREIRIFIGGEAGNVTFSPPKSEEFSVLPHSCRLENKTYAFDIQADIEVQYIYEKDKDTQTFKNVLLGQIPLLLKSSLCYLRGLTSEQLYDVNECKLELGGYFIIGGQERVLLIQESLGANMFTAKKRIQGPSPEQIRTRSEKETKEILSKNQKENKFEYICGISCESEDGTLKGRHLLVIPPENKRESDPQKIAKEKDFSNFSNERVATIYLPGFDNEIPLISVFYALGFTTDQAIYDVTFAGIDERTMYDTLFAELILSHDKYLAREILKEDDQQQDMNLLFLRRQTRTRSDGAVFSNLYSKLFSHCEKRDESTASVYKRKGFLLGHMFKMAMDVALGAENTDRDHFRFKRLSASGELMFGEFRRIYNEISSTMKLQLDRRIEFEKQTYKGRELSSLIQEENLPIYWKSYIFLSEFEKSFKGSWNGENGVAQVLSRISYMGSISHLRRINLMMDKETKQVAPRKLHSSSWGYTCPVDNPDGKNIGLIKSLSLFASISTATSIQDLKSKLSYIDITSVNPSHYNSSWTKLFLNSDLIGVIKNTETFHLNLVQLRRESKIPKTVSLTWNILENTYEIFCGAGRPYRYIYQENVKPELIRSLKSWESMKKYMDFIDPAETETVKLSMESFSSLPSEIHGTTIFSPSASIIPFIDHNQAPRNMFACQQVKQTCSWYSTAFDKRFDKDSKMHMHNVQRPICQTWTTHKILGECLSYGENIFVAIAIYGGYNQEDSVILNQAAVDRGQFYLTYYHSYDEQESIIDPATQEHTVIANLTQDSKYRETVERMQGKEYGYLDSEGIIKVGSPVLSDTVLIGMVSPKTNDAGHILGYKDISILPKKGERGRVDAIAKYTTPEGLRGIKIRISESRKPIIGDKFGSRHGQKGTVGILLPEEDMPCTAEGLRPDMIINPHALPSRMTIGQFLECMSSNIGLHLGSYIDGTPFTTQKRIGDTKDILVQLGYHPYGNQFLYNGQSGELIQSEIFLGPTFYQRFKHMVEDKINYRSTGPRTLLTHQPLEGRANDGGLRIGEMERDALLSHGTSHFLQESMMKRSDEHTFLYNKETGVLDYGEDSGQRTMPYSAGLFVKELESMHFQISFS
jgi:DNA-directed RNA polymerase II subunit RPB2